MSSARESRQSSLPGMHQWVTAFRCSDAAVRGCSQAVGVGALEGTWDGMRSTLEVYMYAPRKLSQRRLRANVKFMCFSVDQSLNDCHKAMVYDGRLQRSMQLQIPQCPRNAVTR
jgi:hypothetical protein